MNRNRLRFLAIAALLALGPAPGLANEQTTATREERREEIRREDDRRPDDQIWIPMGENSFIIIGGYIKLEAENRTNFNTNLFAANDLANFTFSANLEASMALHRHLRVFAEVKVRGDKILLDDTGEEVDLFSRRMGETWLYLRELFDGHLGFRIGRQKFRDARRWIYDWDLDAARVYIDHEPFGVELALSQQLFNPRARERDVTRYSVYASYEPRNKLFVDAYLFGISDRSAIGEAGDRDDSSPVWIGLRSYGRVLDKSVKYWADAAYLTGTSRIRRRINGEYTAIRSDLSAYAFDFGATLIVRSAPVRFSVTAGVAYGSGDTDLTDGVDRQFRQTGLHRNKSRFDGVESFRYYGLLLDPELSNMTIVTVGFGVRPTRKSSIDVVFHSYSLNQPATTLRDTNLDSDPNGTGRSLGNELDVIAAWHPSKRYELELNFAVFVPETGFLLPDRDTAYIVGLEFEFNF